MHQNVLKRLLLMLLLTVAVQAAPFGAVKEITGTVALWRGGSWRAIRPGMGLRAGDSVRTAEESRAVISRSGGGILRVDEETLLVITASTPGERAGDATLLTGRLWANMKKLAKKGTSFGVVTPTAVAAIRGTVFGVDAEGADATEVAVHEGSVAVAATSKADPGRPASSPGDIHEVPGPGEIPGPHEVSLEEWITIVAGQQIRVESSGSVRTWDFDPGEAGEDSWIRYNIEEDKRLGE
jgi:hypothetical protein